MMTPRVNSRNLTSVAERGRVAFTEKKAITANPYARATENWVAWNGGYLKAKGKHILRLQRAAVKADQEQKKYDRLAAEAARKRRRADAYEQLRIRRFAAR